MKNRALIFGHLFVFATLLALAQQKNNCPLEGRGEGHQLDANEKYLNRHKNRAKVPKLKDFAKSVTLDKIFHSGDDSSRFDDEKAVTVVGYIFKAMSEKGESCNCHSSDKEMWDTHICISNKPITDKTTTKDCSVIEITPYSRKLHPEWTTAYINKTYKGKKVKITGWLLYDFKHKFQSHESDPKRKTNVRQTVWEVHPVTNLELAQ